jgi:hypothetical protein
VLSSFGVDTVDSEDFRTALRAGRCSVVVTESFRVVPQKPRVTSERRCARLRRVNGDIVADRCTGGPPATISLTKLR